MNTNTISTGFRAVALAAVLAAAAASGLIVGNAIQGGPRTNAGYPIGWQGGAAVPTTRTAEAKFSLDALSAVRAARGDAQATSLSDYGTRHQK